MTGIGGHGLEASSREVWRIHSWKRLTNQGLGNQIKNGWSGNLAACDKNDSTLYGAVTADMSSETFTLQNGKGNFNLKFSLRDANGVENKVVIAFK